MKVEYSGSENLYQLIWDLSDNNELAHFSAIVSSYVNPHNNKRISPLIIPHILGGLSHDWAELQIADLISNYALNYSAHGIFSDCDEEKSDAFSKHIYPILHARGGKIKGYGWKFFK